VTIPRSLRDKFNLSVGDEVFFDADKDMIRIKPARLTLASVYGSVRPLKKRLSYKKIREIAIEEKVNASR